MCVRACVGVCALACTYVRPCVPMKEELNLNRRVSREEGIEEFEKREGKRKRKRGRKF